MVLLYNKNNKSGRNGFTLIEVMVAIVIVAILGGVGYLSVSKLLSRKRLENSIISFANVIQNVKNDALTQSQIRGVKLFVPDTFQIVYFDNTGSINIIMSGKLSYAKFGTISGINDCPDGDPIDMSDGIRFPDNTILFLPIGIARSHGCVVVNDGRNVAALVVSPTGKIDTYINLNGNWVKK